MAKKANKEEVTLAEQVEETVETVVEEVKEAVAEVVEAVSEFAVGVEAEIKDFYVRAYNGLKGIIEDVQEETGEITVKIADGVKAIFKKENLRVK